jgi:uncharacterized protein (DUF305 family)
MGDAGYASSGSGENAASNYSQQDIMFAQMMIPHHEQALDMSVLALATSTNEDVLDLAQRIFDGQRPEIELMQSWIDSGARDGGMSHEMPDGTMMDDGIMGGGVMEGMVSDEGIAELSSLESPEFDRLFLELMIGHHEGALAMVQMIESSDNAEVQALAQEIAAAQEAEIAQMKLVLEGLDNA